MATHQITIAKASKNDFEKAYVLCTIKSIEDTQYKIEDCRPNGSDLPF